MRRSHLAAIVLSVLVAGCNAPSPNPSVAPKVSVSGALRASLQPASSPATLPASLHASSLASLRPVKLNTTAIRYTDHNLREYQDAMDRVSKDFQDAQTTLIAHIKEKVETGTTGDYSDTLDKMRTAAQGISEYPITPIKAEVADKKYSAAGEQALKLTDLFGAALADSSASNVDSLIRVNAEFERQLAAARASLIAVGVADQGGKMIAHHEKRYELRAGEHPDVPVWRNRADFDAVMRMASGAEPVSEDALSDQSDRGFRLLAGVRVRLLNIDGKARAAKVQIVTGPSHVGETGYVHTAWLHRTEDDVTYGVAK